MSGFDSVGRSSGFSGIEGTDLPDPSAELRADLAPPHIRSEPILSAPVSPHGFTHPRAPNGRILPFDTTRVEEEQLLRRGGKAALYALGGGPGDFHPEREPLILVHGINGTPSVLQGVIERFKSDDRYQLYVLCYDDDNRRTSLNGADLAEELKTLQQRNIGAGRDVTVIAHSMGGIVTREAMNKLGADGAAKFGDVRVFTADTPWHGYDGPSDRGIEGVFMGFARPFMPDGLEDMRGRSAMFEGLHQELPENISVHMAFAAMGKEIEGHGEGSLEPLAQSLADLYNDDKPVRGSTRVTNFWRAMLGSAQYGKFAGEMRDLADERRITAADVQGALDRHFPRFPGNHDGMLKEQPGGKGYLDYLTRELRKV